MVTSYQPAPPVPPTLPPPGPPRRQRGLLGVTAAAMCIFAASAAGFGLGLAVGQHVGAQPTAAPPAAPIAHDVQAAATVYLCTQWVAGYGAMPKVQRSPADVVPELTYVEAALNDTPAADGQIRDAVAESLRLGRLQAAWLSHEPAQGAIQTPSTPNDSESNAADQLVWDLCRAYGS